MKEEITQPYKQYDCFGRYMEPLKPWTALGGGCSQTCDRRFGCYQTTRKNKNAQAK